MARTKRNEDTIKALVRTVWIKAGRDPAKITSIQPFENNRYNKNWSTAGMGIKVIYCDTREIFLRGAAVDDAIDGDDDGPLVQLVEKAAPY